MSCVPALTLSVQKLGQTFKWLLMVNQMAATACGQTVWRSPGRHVTDGSSERVTVDNVSWGQKSTFSTITQNEIRKNLKLLLYHFRDIVYKPTHTQCRETRMPSWTDKFHTHRKRQAGTQQPTPWLTDAQSIFISTFSRQNLSCTLPCVKITQTSAPPLPWMPPYSFSLCPASSLQLSKWVIN